jgi:hypothetical protein
MEKKSGPGAADRSANARTVILPAIITHTATPETSGVNSPNFFPEHGKEKRELWLAACPCQPGRITGFVVQI